MPTKTRPCSFKVGPSAAQISRSRAVSVVLTARPPTWRLARASPAAGTAVDGARGLAVDQHDALVALAHRRQVALHHDRLAVEEREHFQERIHILVVGLDAEYARAAIAEERLQDDVAVRRAEGGDLVAVAR